MELGDNMETNEKTYNAVQAILEAEGKEDLLPELKEMIDIADIDDVDCTKDMINLLYETFVSDNKLNNPFIDESGTLITISMSELGGCSEGDSCLVCTHERMCYRAEMIKQHFPDKKMMFMCDDYNHDGSFDDDEEED